MAKEIKEVPSSSNKGCTKSVTQQHGEIALKCNKCGTEMKVPTTRFYAASTPARPAEPAVTVPAVIKDGETLKEAYTIHAKPFRPKRSLQHHDFGCDCEGTFSTVPSGLKRKAWLKSRDRKPRGGQKG